MSLTVPSHAQKQRSAPSKSAEPDSFLPDDDFFVSPSEYIQGEAKVLPLPSQMISKNAKPENSSHQRSTMKKSFSNEKRKQQSKERMPSSKNKRRDDSGRSPFGKEKRQKTDNGMHRKSDARTTQSHGSGKGSGKEPPKVTAKPDQPLRSRAEGGRKRRSKKAKA